MKRQVIIGFGSVLALLLVALLISYSFYEKAKETAEKMISKEMLIMADQTARGIEDLIKDYVVETEWLTELPQIRKIREPETTVFLDKERKDKPYMRLVVREDRNGIVTYINPPDALKGIIGKDFSFRDYFKAARSTGKVAISGMIESGQYEEVKDRFKGIVIAAPLFTPDGTFDGVLGSVIAITDIANRFVLPVTVGSKGYAWMLDGQGVTMVHPDAGSIGEKVAERNVIAKSLLDRMFRGEKGFGEYTRPGEKGKKLMAFSAVKVDGHIWPVGVSVPYTEVEMLVYPIYTRLLILMIFVVGIILGGGVVFMRKAAEVRRLKDKIVALEIRIDEKKRSRDVESITETDYFRTLAEKAEEMKVE